MKIPPEYTEEPGAFKRFDAAIGNLLSVSHDDLKQREEEYKKKAALNPKKRGPEKGKRKSSAPDAGA